MGRRMARLARAGGRLHFHLYTSTYLVCVRGDRWYHHHITYAVYPKCRIHAGKNHCPHLTSFKSANPPHRCRDEVLVKSEKGVRGLTGTVHVLDMIERRRDDWRPSVPSGPGAGGIAECVIQAPHGKVCLCRARFAGD
jgi:hypothetical protein